MVGELVGDYEYITGAESAATSVCRQALYFVFCGGFECCPPPDFGCGKPEKKIINWIADAVSDKLSALVDFIGNGDGAIVT